MTTRLNKLLDFCVEKEVSDLHLAVGSPPVVRLYGNLRPIKSLSPLEPEDTDAFMKAITSERCQQELQEVGGTDFGFSYKDKARFRVSVFKQKGHVGLVLRQIPKDLMSFEEIGLSSIIKSICLKPRGLILVTGPTGSGKTTSLASMIDFINREADRHIITVEDPIEFYHEHKKSVITQREVGVDVPSFEEALRRSLRMDPDIILVGEMRDLETIEAAITAAETGHLVMGTLHTTGATKTVNRIVDVFPEEQQAQIRTQLAVALECIISQVLMPRADKEGLIAAFEILVMNSACRHLIRENQTHKIISQMQTGKQSGMELLDDNLFDLYKEGKIDYDQAMQKAQNSSSLQERIMEYSKEQAE